MLLFKNLNGTMPPWIYNIRIKIYFTLRKLSPLLQEKKDYFWNLRVANGTCCINVSSNNEVEESYQEFFDSKELPCYFQRIPNLSAQWQNVVDYEGVYLEEKSLLLLLKICEEKRNFPKIPKTFFDQTNSSKIFPVHLLAKEFRGGAGLFM